MLYGFGRGLSSERQTFFIGIVVDENVRRRAEALGQDLACHRVFDKTLDGALKRSCAVMRIKSFFEEMVLRFVRKLNRKPLSFESVFDAANHELKNLLHVFLGEGVEEDEWRGEMTG